MKFKVLMTDYAWPNVDIERETLAAADAELVVADDKTEAGLAAQAAAVDAIMTNWVRVPESVIAAGPKLRIVARLGIGLDNIDIAACTKRKIVVTNCPDYCLIEVAEQALAMILALGRKVAFYHLESKQGRYELQAGPPLRRITGQTLGIVGLGNIGRKLAEKALGIGLKVIAADKVRGTLPAGVAWREFDELLAESDYVSLHVPLLPSTKHLMGREQFARMKPSAYLVNTARGGLVDQAALAEALAAGQLAGAALDVQETEPPDLRVPPLDDPRVIVTPHSAFASLESLADLRRRVSRQVADRLHGRVPENVVNPEVLK
ncbi:MAG: C-terminal binding protein [Pirellulales bacterium]|nr:C-terminal binding protein [Pirellulales bacterium]